MTIQIAKEARKEAITSIERYARENFPEPIGSLEADSLLTFFLEEIGPLVYNKAVTDVQERLQARIMEVDIEVHEAEFQYWRKKDNALKRNASALPTHRVYSTSKYLQATTSPAHATACDRRECSSCMKERRD